MEAVLLLEGKACRCLWPGRLVPTCFLGFLGFLPPDLLLRRARRASGRSGAHSTLSNTSSQQHILLCDKLNRAPRHRPFSLAILRSPRLSRQRLRHGTSPETQRCGDVVRGLRHHLHTISRSLLFREVRARWCKHNVKESPKRMHGQNSQKGRGAIDQVEGDEEQGDASGNEVDPRRLGKGSCLSSSAKGPAACDSGKRKALSLYTLRSLPKRGPA